MRKTNIIQLLIIFLILIIIPGSIFSQNKPNIVVILTDDQGYGDVGFHGNPYLKTPQMESIAKNGMEMTHFFSYPNCSASRAALLTGRYPYRTGVTAVTQVDHFMNTSELTIAEVLLENGYRTGIFGKWHLGDNHPMRPTDQGFQEALVHKGGGIGQAAGPPDNSYFDPVLEHNDTSKMFRGYCDDIFTNAALSFMSSESEKPFFIYLATNLPHFPLEVPEIRANPYREMGLHEDNALTYGMIDNIDYNVGRILERINSLGIAENTLVIFLSDNGPRHRRTKNDVYPGRWVSNLRGTKTSVYECGIRVPFFVQWPGRIPHTATSRMMGSVIDLFPTLLDASNIELPKDVKIDGQSLLALWEGKPVDYGDREFITQMHYGPTPFKYMHFAVRTQHYKLVSPHDDPHHILFQPGDDQLKKTLASLELYEIEKDPSERINIAEKFPGIVEDLLARYESWFDEVTQERDEKGIQRIFLGTESQPNVNLSRFDWGGPRVLSENELGHWRVRTEQGMYDVEISLPKISAEGVVHFKYKQVHLQMPVNLNQKKIVFNSVQLPGGNGVLQVYLKIDRLATGPLFVDVKRLDLH